MGARTASAQGRMRRPLKRCSLRRRRVHLHPRPFLLHGGREARNDHRPRLPGCGRRLPLLAASAGLHHRSADGADLQPVLADAVGGSRRGPGGVDPDPQPVSAGLRHGGHPLADAAVEGAGDSAALAVDLAAAGAGVRLVRLVDRPRDHLAAVGRASVHHPGRPVPGLPLQVARDAGGAGRRLRRGGGVLLPARAFRPRLWPDERPVPPSATP